VNVWDRLAEIQDRAANDAEFCSTARTDVPALVAALRAVQDGLGPHYDSQVRRNAKFGRIGSDCVCEGCNTYRAVEAALGEAMS